MMTNATVDTTNVIPNQIQTVSVKGSMMLVYGGTSSGSGIAKVTGSDMV